MKFSRDPCCRFNNKHRDLLWRHRCLLLQGGAVEDSHLTIISKKCMRNWKKIFSRTLWGHVNALKTRRDFSRMPTAHYSMVCASCTVNPTPIADGNNCQKNTPVVASSAAPSVPLTVVHVVLPVITSVLHYWCKIINANLNLTLHNNIGIIFTS